MIPIQHLAIILGIPMAALFVCIVIALLHSLFQEIEHLKQRLQSLSEFVDRMNARPGVTHLRSETIERT